MRVSKRMPDKFIIGLVALAVLAVLSAVGVGLSVSSALALEQAPRCGMEEHVHTEECYVGDILVCGQKMHTHTENCYLVLLRDNDVNKLLTKVAQTSDNSLESLIRNTVVQAVVLSQGGQTVADGEKDEPEPSPTPSPTLDPSIIPSLTPSPSPSPTPLPEVDGEEEAQPITNEDIVQLNAVAAANDVQPRVLLNESLTIQTASEDSMTEEELLAALLSGSGSSGSSSGGSSTYAVGQDPVTTAGYLNFYIYVDGSSYVCIGTTKLVAQEVSFGAWFSQTYYAVSNNTLLGFLGQEEVISSITSLSGYYVRYNTTGGDSSYDQSASSTNVNGYQTFGITNTATRYAILTTRSGNWNNYTYTPVPFYTVTLDYSRNGLGENQVQYVQSGQASTLDLDSDYFWYDASDDSQVTSLPATITATTTLYAKAKNVTVTLLNQNGNYYNDTPESIAYNSSYTLPTLPEDTTYWVDEEGNTYSPGYTFENIKTDLTLQAFRYHTITYNDTNGTFITSAEAQDGADYTVTEDPGEGNMWASADKNYLNGETISNVTGDITLTKTAYHTVTYTYRDAAMAGENHSVRVIDGSAYTVDAPASGYAWFTEAGVLFTDTEINPVTEDITLTGVRKYTVSVQQTPGGSYTDYTYYNGDTFTVPKPPAGYVWSDGTNTYTGGQTVTVSSDLTFTLQAEDPLTVTYDVNFSVSSGSGLNAPSETPTLVGNAADTVTAGSSYTVNTVSDRTVVCPLTGLKSRSGTAYFVGWQVNGTSTIIQPSVNLTWEELKSYADGSGTVALTGVWNSQMLQSVNFFVEYTSGTANVGSAAAYTPAIFTTYVGGIDDEVSNGITWLNNQYAINNGSTFTNEGETTPLLCDQKVRALYGDTGGDIWLAELPSDTYIFELLKQYASSLRVPVEGKTDDEGNQLYETVNVDDLNEYGYAVRWYTFKVAYDNGSDAMTWHIDGRLIRKVGKVHTTKTFAGNSTLIEAAKNGFYITAVNEDASKHIIMTLEEASTTEQSRILAERGWDASIVTSWITPIDDGDGDPNTYLWEFDDIKYNEQWVITEYPPDLSDLAKYNEWIVVDSSALGQSNAGEGDVVSVKGVTQATDLEDPEWLRAEFNNIYYLNNSLMLKKEDGSTGLTLDGVQFRFYQDGYLITFDYSADKGLYVRNSLGTGAYDALTVGEGYANISLDGFSYEKGDIVIQEVSPPTGYELVGEVRVGYTGEVDKDGNQIVGITNSADYAQYHDGLVVIQNNPSLRNVTVTKTWNCAESEKGDVVVQLLANGDVGLTARILAGRKDAGGNAIPATVTIKEAGGWTYTWENMPLYANGEKVEYSIREIKIGGESCKSDYTFSNWLVVYKAPVTDAAGNITLGVENITPSRPILYLNKIDMLGRPLAGAVFELVEVDTDGSVKADAIPKTATTADDGSLNFDNLTYGARYRLTELSAPEGYWAYTDPVYLTVTEDGKVNLEGTHEYVSADSAPYTVTVTNRSADKLPETGGGGTNGYYATGVMLILLALCVTILPQIRKRGRYRMRR